MDGITSERAHRDRDGTGARRARRVRRVFEGLLAVCLAAGAAGCAAPEEEVTPLVDCSTAATNERLLGLMRDVYLWNDQIPDVDPRSYPSAEALLEDLLYPERDHWSYVAPRSRVDAYYRDGESLGIGARWKYDAAGAMRFALVYPGSAAEEAGLARGDELLAVNGKTVAEIEDGELWGTITGEDAEGVEVTLAVRKESESGEAADVAVRKRWYSLQTVSAQEVLEVGGRKVGYLALDRFIGPSGPAITEAFAGFHEEGVEDLVLDLRYNGGGLTETARYLASLIGGKEIDGRAYSVVMHNDRHRDWDGVARFELREHALNLKRVAIIATGATASASEMLINGLRPWLDAMAVIGDTTYGKPVGMRSYQDCGMTITPIMFRALNADGNGDFYDGLPVDCPAEDQVGAPLGDPTESSLAEALHWLESGACSTADRAPAERGRAEKPLRLPGLLGEIGAF